MNLLKYNQLVINFTVALCMLVASGIVCGMVETEAHSKLGALVICIIFAAGCFCLVVSGFRVGELKGLLAYYEKEYRYWKKIGSAYQEKESKAIEEALEEKQELVHIFKGHVLMDIMRYVREAESAASVANGITQEHKLWALIEEHVKFEDGYEYILDETSVYGQASLYRVKNPAYVYNMPGSNQESSTTKESA